MKFHVHLARIRLEVAEIDVDVPETAGSDGRDKASRATAEMMAKLAARTMPASKWKDWEDIEGWQYREEVYEPWVSLSASEFDAEANGLASLADLVAESTPLEDTRYLLLEADVASGEGRVIFQPWYRSEEVQHPRVPRITRDNQL